jgi:hypothetical protein
MYCCSLLLSHCHIVGSQFSNYSSSLWYYHRETVYKLLNVEVLVTVLGQAMRDLHWTMFVRNLRPHCTSYSGIQQVSLFVIPILKLDIV